MRKSRLLSFIFLCGLTVSAYAMKPFTIQKISIQGLQGISMATVYSYLPVKVGDHLDDQVSTDIIQKLYRTGFFDNIILDRDDDTLIIKVVQRPIISRLTISGNKTIPTKKLKSSLKTANFSEGQVYNPSLLENIKTSLKHEYFALGKYNAQVNVTVTKEPRNRVAITLDISEGAIAKIHQIHIIGNHAFSQRTLLRDFKLSTSNLISWITDSDQYSSEKLEADLETLRSYYMNRGYLAFKILSTQVSITPDHKQVYITIHVSEGAQYKVSGYSLTGKLVLPKDQLEKLIELKKGEIFSRKDVVDANDRMSAALSNVGYTNAVINVDPKVDEKNKTVFVSFKVVPGPRIYVRRITFSGNYRTNDETLRRRLLQYEGGVLSSKIIKDSKRQLMLLPYIRDVNATTSHVEGTSNQSDVNYAVTEQSAATLQAGIAYSQLDRFMVTGSIEHKNIFGTGNSLALSIATSSPSTSLNLSYYNPYYTKSGIGRSVSAYATHFNAEKANVANYDTNEYGAALGYNFRLTENDSLQWGMGYSNTFLGVGSTPSKELNNFTGKYGRHFYQFSMNAGWVSQGFDRVVFPTRGVYQSATAFVTVPFSGSSLEYYKLDYLAFYYHPILKGFLAQLRGSINYGNGYGKYRGDLPFFRNFYVGGSGQSGLGTVRGYEDNSLGPKDSNGDPLGGNFALSGTAGLVVPNPISQNVRTTLFVDGGNAYEGVKLSHVRYSAGLAVDWLSPIGMLSFSLGEPLNNRKSDDTELFQFHVGATF